jgi:hypothetical protein
VPELYPNKMQYKKKKELGKTLPKEQKSISYKIPPDLTLYLRCIETKLVKTVELIFKFINF